MIAPATSRRGLTRRSGPSLGGVDTCVVSSWVTVKQYHRRYIRGDKLARATEVERYLQQRGAYKFDRAARAHQTEVLLDEADARLVIDAALTVLYYLGARLSAVAATT